MKSCSNEACDVSHIYEEVCADFISDLSELLEVDDPGVSGSTCNDYLRLALKSLGSDRIVIEHLCLLVYLVELRVICSSGNVDLHTVC